MAPVPPIPSPAQPIAGQSVVDPRWYQWLRSVADRLNITIDTAPVPAARKIISGNGLTGGGDLSADRTLNVGAGTGIQVNPDTVEVLYGTTAGTAAQGNDTRITGAFPSSAAAALTGANDINVTIALGGSPATAVLHATSVTLGWAGQLAVARGGTGGGTASGTLLDNITGWVSTGIIARTGSGSYGFRTITAPAAGVTVTFGNGVSGDPTLALANDLLAVEGLSGTGIARRTGTDAWSVGTTVSVAEGGAGITSYTIGDLLYASDTTPLSKLADIATGNALISGGVGVAPAWGKVGLSTHVSGVLPATSGGTGSGLYTLGDILYASTTTNLNTLGIAAGGNVLISGTTPTWGKVGLTTHVSGRLAFANIVQLSARTVVCNPTNAAGDADVAQGTANQVFIANSAGTGVGFGSVNLAAAAAVTGALAEVNGGTNQNTFTAGDLLQATAANTLGKLAAVATGNALISGGVGAASSWGKIGLTTHISGTLAIGNGGTGQTTATAAFDALSPNTTRGDITIRNATTNARLAVGANHTVLKSNGTDPSYGQVDLAADVTGTLPAANGGTGDTGGAWATSTPTPSADSGAFTGSPSSAISTLKIGRHVIVTGTINTGTGGRAGGILQLTLPYTPATSGMGSAMEVTNFFGGLARVLVSDTTLRFYKYDATTILVAGGQNFQFTVEYQSTT